MQYHCTEGGSLHYPSCSRKDKIGNANTYRPKINRKQTRSSTATYNFDDNFTSETVRCKLLNDSGLDQFNSARFGNVSTVSSETVKDVKFWETDFDKTEDTDSSISGKTGRIMFDIADDKKPTKRKYSKKDFTFRPDENYVEESYCDSESSCWKKTKSMHLNFTPSKDCIETNVLQITHLRNGLTDDENKVSKNSRLSQVYKMRKVQNENLYSRETETIALCSRTVKGNKECKREPGDTENIETDRYNSGDDLFADVDATRIWETQETKVEPTSDSSNIEYLDAEAVGGDLCISLSQSSDGGESLPDIGLDIMAKKKEAVGNFCFVNGSVSNKDESDSVIGNDSERTRLNIDTVGRQKRFDSGYDSDTRTGSFDNESDKKVKLVVSVLPNIDATLAREMLTVCNNNVDMCVAELLERSSESFPLDLTSAQN